MSIPKSQNSEKPHRLCCIGLDTACSNRQKNVLNNLQEQE